MSAGRDHKALHDPDRFSRRKSNITGSLGYLVDEYTTKIICLEQGNSSTLSKKGVIVPQKAFGRRLFVMMVIVVAVVGLRWGIPIALATGLWLAVAFSLGRLSMHFERETFQAMHH